MDNLNEKALKEVLSSLYSEFENDAIKMSSLSEDLIDNLLSNYDSKRDFGHLCKQLDFSQYGISLFLSKAILGKHEVVNLTKEKKRLFVSFIKNYKMIELNLDNLFTKYETMCCSHDKTRTVLSHYFNYLLFDKEIHFDYNQEYTFHLPKKVLKTHDEVVGYISTLNSLSLGRIDEYVSLINGFDKKYL